MKYWLSGLKPNMFTSSLEKTYVDNFMSRKFSTAALEETLCNIQCLFRLWKCFWLTVETKLDKTSKVIFTNNSENSFHSSEFLGQKKTYQVVEFNRRKTTCLDSKGSCSTWFVSTDSNSSYQGTWFPWLTFLNKKSALEMMKGLTKEIFLTATCQLRRMKNWLTALF